MSALLQPLEWTAAQLGAAVPDRKLPPLVECLTCHHCVRQVGISVDGDRLIWCDRFQAKRNGETARVCRAWRKSVLP